MELQLGENIAETFTSEKNIEKTYLLWTVITDNHDVIDLIALCEGTEFGEDAEWKKAIYEMLQEALLDERIISDPQLFEEFESMIDKMMSYLNLGLTLSPTLIHFMRTVLAFTFRMVVENEWTDALKAPDPDVQSDPAVDRAMYTIMAAVTGLVFTDITKWITRGPLPMVYKHKGIISRDDADEDKVDFAIVKELLAFLVDRGIIRFDLPPAAHPGLIVGSTLDHYEKGLTMFPDHIISPEDATGNYLLDHENEMKALPEGASRDEVFACTMRYIRRLPPKEKGSLCKYTFPMEGICADGEKADIVLVRLEEEGDPAKIALFLEMHQTK